MAETSSLLLSLSDLQWPIHWSSIMVPVAMNRMKPLSEKSISRNLSTTAPMRWPARRPEWDMDRRGGNTIFTCPYGNAYDQISHERSIHHHCLADEGQVRYGLDQYNARHDEGLGGELRTRCSDNIRQRDIYIQICIFTDGHDSETNRRVAHTDSSETKVDNIRHRTSISGL